MFKNIILLMTTFLSINDSFSSMDRVWEELSSGQRNIGRYPLIIRELVSEGLYFASIPYIKEFLLHSNGNSGRKIDLLIDSVVTHVGVKQFEVLPESILKRSNAPILNYIMAKKSFRKGKYNTALKRLKNSIPSHHPTRPFALFLEASIYSIKKSYNDSINSYRECVDVSEKAMKRANSFNLKKQLEINRDYCVAGIARTYFAAGKFEASELAYLDLGKESSIWPEILFEEAWNSFYLKSYNRTLGKLVTYKAPVLDFVFNPEVEILRALTYMELCLWKDSQNVVNNFYRKYDNQAEYIRSFIKKHGKDYKYYYFLAKNRTRGRIAGSKVLNQLLKTIIKDPAYIELYDSFRSGREELEITRRLRHSSLKKILTLNLKESMLLQRNLIGAYVRKQLDMFVHQLENSYQGISYIRLEVLDRLKKSLYNSSFNRNRSRGDLRNLKRNEKQYFWTFNGEFWADELGDYVFSLKSECN